VLLEAVVLALEPVVLDWVTEEEELAEVVTVERDEERAEVVDVDTTVALVEALVVETVTELELPPEMANWRL